MTGRGMNERRRDFSGKRRKEKSVKEPLLNREDHEDPVKGQDALKIAVQ